MQKVASFNELEDGGVKGIKIGSLQIAIYRTGEKVFATDDLCTHEYCVISENHVMHGREVECTCHGSHFNIETGENTVPPAAEPLVTYKVEVKNGEVFVDV